MTDKFENKILVIDDEEQWADRIKEIFTDQGFRYIDTRQGVGKFSELLHDYSLAVIDIKMPRFDGFQIKNYLKHNSPGTKILLISQYEDFGIDILDKAKGADGWFKKQNFDDNEASFIMLIDELLENATYDDINKSNRDKIDGINIKIDIANTIGIKTSDQVELMRTLDRLKKDLEDSKSSDGKDLAVDVDQIRLELSKDKKDKNFIINTLEKIGKGVGYIASITEHINKISDIIGNAF